MSPLSPPRRWARSALVCAGLLTSAVCLCPGAGAFAAGARPSADSPAPISPAALLDRLQALYQKAEQATEAYDATHERLEAQRARADVLSRQLADARRAVTAGLDRAGALARARYRGGAVSPYARLLLSDDPAEALNQAHILQQAAASQAHEVGRLRAEEHRLAGLTAQARAVLAETARLDRQQRDDRDQVQARLGDVEKAVAVLNRRQLDELAALEQRGVVAAQRSLLASGRLGTVARMPSVAGEKAIGYAVSQLGKPYVWGSAGPNAFDCSGLTSQAWAHAGRHIPRTSQGQWARLRHVPLNQLRPGDLVVYYPGATHVALYIGNALVVQAPRPGDVVKVTPIAANPVLGGVRPDAGAPSMPRRPEGGQDTGTDADGQAADGR